MTVTTTNVYNGPFIPNGATTSFPFTFTALSASQVLVQIDGVTLDPLTYTVNMTISTVVFPVAPTGANLFIFSNPDFTQQTSFENEGRYYPQTFEDTADKLTTQTQYLLDRSKRSITLPRGVTGDVAVLPPGYFLGTDAYGNVVGLSGTGADAGLRTDLAATNGSSLVKGASRFVATRTAMETQPTGVGQVVFLTEAGRSGAFIWQTGDYAARVASDTLQGLYVASTVTAATTGCWVRDWSGLGLRPEWFGAVADGVTADTTAFNASLVLAAALGVNIALGAKSYAIGQLNQITTPNLSIVGIGYLSKLVLSYNGPTFRWSGAFGGGLSSLQLSYASPGNAATVALLDNASSTQTFDNLLISNVGTLIQTGSTTTFSYATTIRNLQGSIANAGRPLVKIFKAAGIFLQNSNAYVNGVSVPINNRTSTMTTVSGTNLIEAVGGATLDTLEIKGGLYERWFRILNLISDGSGAVIQNVFVDTTCDYIRDDCYHIEANSGTGGVVDVALRGYLTCWEGVGVNILGPGVVRNVDAATLKIFCSGSTGINVQGVAARDIKLDGAQVEASNRSNIGANGITLQDGSGFSAKGVVSGVDGTYGGFAWQAAVGLAVGANVNRMSVVGANCDGATAGYSFATNTMVSGDRRVHDNLNATYSGYKTTAPYVIPATTVPWVNYSPFEIEITVAGGTVTGIQHNSIVTGLTSGTFTIQPGDSFTLTYTGSPTVLFYVKP